MTDSEIESIGQSILKSNDFRGRQSNFSKHTDEEAKKHQSTNKEQTKNINTETSTC